jgi:hypothetical protein
MLHISTRKLFNIPLLLSVLAATANLQAYELFINHVGDPLPDGYHPQNEPPNGTQHLESVGNATDAIDLAMRSYATANSIVHFSPGTYNTWGAVNGNWDNSVPQGFRLLNGVKIHGAGMQGAGGTPRGTTLLLKVTAVRASRTASSFPTTSKFVQILS